VDQKIIVVNNRLIYWSKVFLTLYTI